MRSFKMAYYFHSGSMRLSILILIALSILTGLRAQPEANLLQRAGASLPMRLIGKSVGSVLPQKVFTPKSLPIANQTPVLLQSEPQFTPVPAAYIVGKLPVSGGQKLEVQLKPSAASSATGTMQEIFSHPIRLDLPSGNAAFFVSKRGLGMRFYIFRTFRI